MRNQVFKLRLIIEAIEKLCQTMGHHGLVEKLFQQFDEQLWASGLMPRGGQIIDARLVNVPKNRNKRDENRQIKEGKLPDGWDDKPNMTSQKDRDARWTKKHGKADQLIRRYKVTDAAVDSQVFDDVLDVENSSRSVWTDSAYRSNEREAQLQEAGYISRIQLKGTCNRQLNKREKDANRPRSKVRARVEHIFGFQKTTQGSVMVRTKGMVRTAVKIGMMNLMYNMLRLELLLRRQSVEHAG